MGSREDLAEWAKSLEFVYPAPSSVLGMLRAFATGCQLSKDHATVRVGVYVASGGRVFEEPFSRAQADLLEKFLKKSLPLGLTLDSWDRHAGSVTLKGGIKGWYVWMVLK